MNLPLKPTAPAKPSEPGEGATRGQKAWQAILGSALFGAFGLAVWGWQSLAFALPFFVLSALNTIGRLSVLYLKPSPLSGWIGLSATIWVLGGAVWFYSSLGWAAIFFVAPIVLGLILMTINSSIRK